MTLLDEAYHRLSAIPLLRIARNCRLSTHTRFGIGGPAGLFVETPSEDAFIGALNAVRESKVPEVVIGGGTNLIVSDDGFRGAVLRYTATTMDSDGGNVHCAAGADLQTLVDFTVDRSLAGLHTMTGIPGTVGAAVYGNAGAYGHSISESVDSVRYFDGATIRTATAAECNFRYRESVFKTEKQRIIFAVGLRMPTGDGTELRRQADEILAIRNQKYPPTMKCAGSIFKNLLLSELSPQTAAHVPERVIRDGKVPSAYFLEQVGAKGLTNGGIQVAEYHANLIYNTGDGTARQLVEVIQSLKNKVNDAFGLVLEEEVQYIGFE
ncbi:MAG: UDP-N-acetylmuramate dehydrogenase [Bryobacteraceae bacterium]